MKKRVLILCTHNSCRSQMAEGFWRHYAGDSWEVCSAGLTPVGVDPRAIRVMAEVGVDISRQTSKALDPFLRDPFDLVITVCADADSACPTFSGAGRKEHWPFTDPAGVKGSEEERLCAFRRVRDEIAAKIREFLRAS